MGGGRWVVFGLVAGLVATAGTASAHPREEFAIHLMKQRDYFRAITVYKELALYERDPSTRAHYHYRIGLAYRLSRHYELSLRTLEPLVGLPEAEELQGRVHLQLALSQLGMHSPAGAAYHLDVANQAGESHRAELIAGYVRFETGDLDEARTRLASAASPGAPPSVVALASRVSKATQRVDDLPYRSPTLAALMSAVLPGSGQFYTGHYADGLQAFGFVGAFGFSTYLAYDYDHRRDNPYVLTAVAGTVTALLHLSNILGAERTARFHNERQRQLLVEPLRRDVLEMTF